MNLFCCSFASKKFLKTQERQYKLFLKAGFNKKNIILFKSEDLDKSFFNDLPNASEINKFGWFSFKPFFLESILQNLDDGDLLLYLDTNDAPLIGIKDYIINFFKKNPNIDILLNSTNYPNYKYLSNFHKKNFSLELIFSSLRKFQPEAGSLILKNSAKTRSILRVWYELTLINSNQLNINEISRHDQETLFIISNIYSSIKLESWIKYKITGKGLRKFINFEHLRS